MNNWDETLGLWWDREYSTSGSVEFVCIEDLVIMIEFEVSENRLKTTVSGNDLTIDLWHWSSGPSPEEIWSRICSGLMP